MAPFSEHPVQVDIRVRQTYKLISCVIPEYETRERDQKTEFNRLISETIPENSKIQTSASG